MGGVKAPVIERKEETPVVIDGRGQGSWDRENGRDIARSRLL